MRVELLTDETGPGSNLGVVIAKALDHKVNKGQENGGRERLGHAYQRDDGEVAPRGLRIVLFGCHCWTQPGTQGS